MTRSRENRGKMREIAMHHLGQRDGQGWKCVYCRVGLLPYGVNRRDNSPVVDHKTPYSLGGTHDGDNLALCCRKCNSRKGQLTADEYRVMLDIKTRPVLAEYNTLYDDLHTPDFRALRCAERLDLIDRYCDSLQAAWGVLNELPGLVDKPTKTRLQLERSHWGVPQ